MSKNQPNTIEYDAGEIGKVDLWSVLKIMGNSKKIL